MRIKSTKAYLFFTLILTFLITTSVFAAEEPAAAPEDSTEAATTSPTPAPAALPTFKTVMSDKVVDDEAVGEKDVFAKDCAVIYLLAKTDEVKAGQTLKAVWIAEDTHGAAPANYKVDEKSIKVDKDMTKDKNFVANFSLSKPDAGWPLGQYRVEVYVDDQLAQTVKFKVE